MKKRSNSRKLSDSLFHKPLLKFSTTSMTSARVRQQRRNSSIIENQESQSSDNNIRGRRRFLNTSTEFKDVMLSITMALCRQITNRNLIKERLIVYLASVIFCGLINDFVPHVLHNLVLRISTRNILNQYFVKCIWYWNTLLLLPFIALSSSTLNSLSSINFGKLEKELDDYYVDKLTMNSSSSISSTSPSSSSSSSDSLWEAKSIEIVEWLNQPRQSSQQQSIQSLERQPQRNKEKISWNQWLTRTIIKCCHILMIKDTIRFVICTIIYFCSIKIFELIQMITKSSSSSIGNNGFDISGHTFILIFTLFIYVEECAIMNGWETFYDRIYSLSLEFISIENRRDPNGNGQQVFLEQQSNLANNKSINNRILMKLWLQYDKSTKKLRYFFFFLTIISTIWELMLFQTIIFHHTLIEKFIALIWAFITWYLCYRFIFPTLNLNVRKVPSI